MRNHSVVLRAAAAALLVLAPAVPAQEGTFPRPYADPEGIVVDEDGLGIEYAVDQHGAIGHG